MKKTRHKPKEEHPHQERPSWSRKKVIFYLWMFIAQEGLIGEARDFLLEHMDGEALYAGAP